MEIFQRPSPFNYIGGVDMGINLEEIQKKLSNFDEKLNNMMNGAGKPNQGGFNGAVDSMNNAINSGFGKIGEAINKAIGVKDEPHDATPFDETQAQGLGVPNTIVAENIIRPASSEEVVQESVQPDPNVGIDNVVKAPIVDGVRVNLNKESDIDVQG